MVEYISLMLVQNRCTKTRIKHELFSVFFDEEQVNQMTVIIPLTEIDGIAKEMIQIPAFDINNKTVRHRNGNN